MKSHWTVITVVVIILTLSALAFFTYLEKPPSQTETPDGSTPESQEPDSLMRQVFETIEELKKIIEKDPKNLQALITLGNLFYDGSKFEEAIEYYQRALKLDPKNADVWTDMGTMYRQLPNIDSSIICYQKAVQVNPGHKSGWFNLGIVYLFDKKDDKKAVWAWKKFIALSPDDPHVQVIKDEMEKLEKKLK